MVLRPIGPHPRSICPTYPSSLATSSSGQQPEPGCISGLPRRSLGSLSTSLTLCARHPSLYAAHGSPSLALLGQKAAHEPWLAQLSHLASSQVTSVAAGQHDTSVLTAHGSSRFMELDEVLFARISGGSSQEPGGIGRNGPDGREPSRLSYGERSHPRSPRFQGRIGLWDQHENVQRISSNFRPFHAEIRPSHSPLVVVRSRQLGVEKIVCCEGALPSSANLELFTRAIIVPRKAVIKLQPR